MGTLNAGLQNAIRDDGFIGSDRFANGSLEIRASDDTILATFDLGSPAFSGSGTNGEAAAQNVAQTVTASNAGTADHARIDNGNGTYQITGLTVGTSAAEVVVSNTNISSGQDVTLNSFTFTIPNTSSA